MRAMERAGGGFARFGRMAVLSARGLMAALSPRVELPEELFPAGGLEEAMRAAG